MDYQEQYQNYLAQAMAALEKACGRFPNKNGSTLKKNSNINFSTKKVGGKKKNWQSNKPAISRKMQNIGLPALR